MLKVKIFALFWTGFCRSSVQRISSTLTDETSCVVTEQPNSTINLVTLFEKTCLATDEPHQPENLDIPKNQNVVSKSITKSPFQFANPSSPLQQLTYPKALGESLASLESLASTFSDYVPDLKSFLELESVQDEELPSFEEWWRDVRARTGKDCENGKCKDSDKTMNQEKKDSHQKSPSDSTQDSKSPPTSSPIPVESTRPLKERFNFASFDCAASILKANPGASKTTSVLSEAKDQYMLSPCSSPSHFFVVELCEEILIDAILLANYEMFSSTFKHVVFSASNTYPPRRDDSGKEQWTELGHFLARNSKVSQVFNVKDPKIWTRYLKVEIREHYGDEYYCPVSLIRVYGTTMMEDFKKKEEKRQEGKKQQRHEAPTGEDVVAEGSYLQIDATGRGDGSSTANTEAPATQPASDSSSTVMETATSKNDDYRTAIPIIIDSEKPQSTQTAKEPEIIEMDDNDDEDELSEPSGGEHFETPASEPTVTPSPVSGSTASSAKWKRGAGSTVGKKRTPVSDEPKLDSPKLKDTKSRHSKESRKFKNGNNSKSQSQSSTTEETPPPPRQSDTQESVFTTLMRRLDSAEEQMAMTTTYLNEQSKVMRRLIQTMDRKQKQQVLFLITHIQREMGVKLADVANQQRRMSTENEYWRSRMAGNMKEMHRQVMTMSEEMEQRIKWERLHLVMVLVILIVSTARMAMRSNLISPSLFPWRQPPSTLERERSSPWMWDDISLGREEIVLESGDELYFANPSSEFVGQATSRGSNTPSPSPTPTVRSPTPVLVRPKGSPNRQGASSVFVIRNAQDSPLIRRQRSDPNLHLRRPFPATPRPPMRTVSPTSSPLTQFLRGGKGLRRASRPRGEFDAVRRPTYSPASLQREVKDSTAAKSD